MSEDYCPKCGQLTWWTWSDDVGEIQQCHECGTEIVMNDCPSCNEPMVLECQIVVDEEDPDADTWFTDERHCEVCGKVTCWDFRGRDEMETCCGCGSKKEVRDAADTREVEKKT